MAFLNIKISKIAKISRPNRSKVCYSGVAVNQTNVALSRGGCGQIEAAPVRLGVDYSSRVTLESDRHCLVRGRVNNLSTA